MISFSYRGRFRDRRRSPPRYSRSPRHSRSPPPRHARSPSRSREYYSPLPKRRHHSRYVIISFQLLLNYSCFIFIFFQHRIFVPCTGTCMHFASKSVFICSKLLVKHCEALLVSSESEITSLVSDLLLYI